MDFSEIFGFSIILKETLKILPRNGKLMASIAVLSLLVPSILFPLFIYFFQSLMAKMYASYNYTQNPNSDNNNNNNYHVLVKYIALLLAVELSFLIIYNIISHLSSTATILVSAFSYTDHKNLTCKDLLSSISIKQRTWKKNIPSSRKRIFLGVSSHSSSRYLSIVVFLAALLVLTYPNFITICSFLVFGIIVFFCQLYSSVIWALSVVVSVVEDRSSVEAVEKAEKLVKGGQRLHGFMLNVFFNLVALILSLPVFYFIDKWSENVTVYYYGLFFLNSLSLLKMSALMAYTVFYFRCKKHHGQDEEEEIDLIIGDLQYTKLPVLCSDIP
ncbi:hypothetical protein ABFX02_10G134400 [Erythranthe guttata]